MRTARVTLAILLSALAVIACDKGDPVAPIGAKLTVTANPMQIGANGSATIVATVLRSCGAPVNPNTEVHFFTTLGTVNPTVSTTDANGIATTTLHGTGMQGTAKVTASSGGATSPSVDVTVGIKATVLTLDANPNTIDPALETVVRLTATVIDADGNRLPNVLVLFSAEAGTLRSRGTGVRTDSRGIATDSLTITPTDAAVAGADGSITVTAQASSGGQTVNATKSIFVFAAPTPTPTP
jgi:adhesin/invasin